MSKQIIEFQSEDISLSLDELYHACNVQTEWIIELVDEAILEPTGRETSEWMFSGSGLQRTRTVRRLQQDLRINIAGAALVLDLMDEIKLIQAQLEVLNR